MLDLVSEGVLPVIEDLAAKNVSPDPPRRPVPPRLKVAATKHQVIEVGDLEGRVKQAGLSGRLRQKQRVVIGRQVATIAAKEAPHGRVLSDMNLVGSQETELLLVPGLAGPEVPDLEDRVTYAKDVGRPGLEPNRRTKSRAQAGGIAQGVDRRFGRFIACLASDDLNLVAIRIHQAHDQSTPRLFEILHGDGFCFSQAVQILEGRSTKPQAEEPGLAWFCHVNERSPVLGAAIEPTAIGEAGKTEVCKEIRHLLQIRRSEPDMGDILDLDERHLITPLTGWSD